MIEKVTFTSEVTDNLLEITPAEIKDNSEYIIKIKYISNADGSEVLRDYKLSACTAFIPSYCSLEAVNSLVQGCGIPEITMLYHIREASKFAQYLKTGLTDESAPTFEIEQFVRYKAAYDCVLKMYIDKSAANSEEGTLGDVTFKNSAKVPDISKLLAALAGEVKKWQDEVEGYTNAGRAAPMSAIRAYSPKAVTQAGTGQAIQNIGLDFNRGV
jgi:hypothetical protein